MVRAAQLTADAILGALQRGDFYASTGVELTDVTATARDVAVTIRQQGTTKYTVQFVGKGGRVLRETGSSPAQYPFSGDEGYVRVKVVDSNGWMAWTQPVRVAATSESGRR
jgi:predicted flavoprotein YhiN